MPLDVTMSGVAARAMDDLVVSVSMNAEMVSPSLSRRCLLNSFRSCWKVVSLENRPTWPTCWFFFGCVMQLRLVTSWMEIFLDMQREVEAEVFLIDTGAV